jgi:hypothetical protein
MTAGRAAKFQSSLMRIWLELSVNRQMSIKAEMTPMMTLAFGMAERARLVDSQRLGTAWSGVTLECTAP